jgi:hypothetical protein
MRVMSKRGGYWTDSRWALRKELRHADPPGKERAAAKDACTFDMKLRISASCLCPG